MRQFKDVLVEHLDEFAEAVECADDKVGAGVLCGLLSLVHGLIPERLQMS